MKCLEWMRYQFAHTLYLAFPNLESFCLILVATIMRALTVIAIESVLGQWCHEELRKGACRRTTKPWKLGIARWMIHRWVWFCMDNKIRLHGNFTLLCVFLRSRQLKMFHFWLHRAGLKVLLWEGEPGEPDFARGELLIFMVLQIIHVEYNKQVQELFLSHEYVQKHMLVGGLSLLS